MLALATLVVAQVLAQEPVTGAPSVTYKIAGRDVRVEIPATGFDPMPGVATIEHGDWKYLVSSDSRVVARIKDRGGWSDISALHAIAEGKFAETTPVWKVKAFVFRRWDALVDGGGFLVQERSTLERSQIDAVLLGLGKFAAIAEAYGQGRFKVSLDAEVEEQIVDPELFQSDPMAYVRARTNRGTFEADDKVYRGPYDQILLLMPTRSALLDGLKFDDPTVALFQMPVQNEAWSADRLAVDLTNAWGRRLVDSAQQAGWSQLPSTELCEATSAGPYSNLPVLLDGGPFEKNLPRNALSTEAFVQNLEAAKAKTWPLAGLSPLEKALSLRSDPESDVRFPPADPKTPTTWLSDGHIAADWATVPLFWAKANVFGGLSAESVSSHHILFKQAGATGPATNQGFLALWTPRTPREGPADLPVLPPLSAPVPQANEQVQPSKDIGATVQARAAYANKIGVGGPLVEGDAATLVAWLDERDDTLRINTCLALQKVKEPTAVAKLTTLLYEFNPRVVQHAVKALANQESPEVLEILRRGAMFGRYDHVRQACAEALGALNDPKQAAPISTLLSTRNWRSRASAARLIAEMADPTAQMMAPTFLIDTDPMVRLAVVRNVDPNIDQTAKRLLWVSVNDPSDEVRLQSYLKLMQSDDAKMQAEGIKAVRDDSIGVRIALTRNWETVPASMRRTVAQYLLSDPTPVVRAAAVFRAQPDDLAQVWQDKDPRVHRALLLRAKNDGLPVPSDALSALRASPDPEVLKLLNEVVP